jgi:hypothetical protein
MYNNKSDVFQNYRMQFKKRNKNKNKNLKSTILFADTRTTGILSNVNVSYYLYVNSLVFYFYKGY